MIRQLLTWRDDRNRAVWVYDFGSDFDRANDAYCRGERFIDRNPERQLDVCLFGAESVETLRATHGSWFPEGYRVEVVER